MKIGSLFSGYGGLDLAVAEVTGAAPAWHAEVDKHAAAILDARFPGVPNLGDITAVDWATVEPVDIITGGFPCQDVSHAGNRAGIKPGTRSGLWSHMAYIIETLKPRLVVIENVSGLLSADAAGDVEPCPWCLGDQPGGHLRALGAVLADLAEIGFDAAEWASVRASDAGACHRRERVFIVATDAGSEAVGFGTGLRASQPARIGWGRPDDGDPQAPGVALLPTPKASDGPNGGPGMRNGRGQADALPGVVALLPTPAVNDMGDGKTPAAWDEWTDAMRARHGNGNGHGKSLAIEAQRLQPTPRATRGGSATETTALLPPPTSRDWKDGAANNNVPINALLGRAVWADFGPYAAAVNRWATTIGRPAPPPTEPGSNGRPRLSPAFVEWMMGLPSGWVTDTGIPRNAQLKALGNGVVPQQAALALAVLLPRLDIP